MGMWDGFDEPAWARRKPGHRPWWQRLHIYLTGNDPWNKPPKPPASGGGALDPNTQLAINIAIAGAAAGGN
jgi:hypothetical protein